MNRNNLKESESIIVSENITVKNSIAHPWFVILAGFHPGKIIRAPKFSSRQLTRAPRMLILY